MLIKLEVRLLDIYFVVIVLSLHSQNRLSLEALLFTMASSFIKLLLFETKTLIFFLSKFNLLAFKYSINSLNTPLSLLFLSRKR